MNNVHSIFQKALAPFAPAPSPAIRPFAVTIKAAGTPQLALNVLAFTSCDAICQAIDMVFDGEEKMPEGLVVSANPVNFLNAS